MASIYYPNSSSVYIRDVQGNRLKELHINDFPDVIFFMTGSGLPYTNSIVFIQTVDTASTYPITASWVQTSSYAQNIVGNVLADYIGFQVFS